MKSLVLTFDDGPDIRYTPVLLDLLRHERIPAAFFVVGNHAKDHPELIKRMVSEGHTVGSHTMAHKNALLSTSGYIKNDFESSERLLVNLTGEPLRYFRPPWGISSPETRRQLRRRRLTRVLWDVMAQDWKQNITPADIADRIKSQVFDGAVICLHDAGEDTGGAKGAPRRTIEALISVLPWLRSQGYQFITMDQYQKGVKRHAIRQAKKDLLWP